MLFVPEAKPRDTNHTVGIIAIWYFDKGHILIAQNVAETCYFEIKHILICKMLKKYQMPPYQIMAAAVSKRSDEMVFWWNQLDAVYTVLQMIYPDR